MRHILIFGGSGMMGFETLLELSQKYAGSDLHIYLLNRGKSWDWDKKKLLSAMLCPITMIKWNRKKPLTDCMELLDVLKKIDKFDAVLDFSGYVKYYIQQAAELLKDKVGIYVYISTDSVYEVCVPSTHVGPTQEADDTRPESEAERERLNEADDYGHEKLECEETLRYYYKQCGFPFVSFRLPDVIGPRDGTERWLQSQLLITALCKGAPHLPMYLQQALQDKPICMVYSRDVAKMVVKIVAMETDQREKLLSESYNLAFEETLSAEYVFVSISGFVNDSALKLCHSDSIDVPIFYPSVMRGPVDINKAKSFLGWKPTSFKQALTETCQFYAAALKQEEYKDDMKSCKKDVLKDIKNLYSETDYSTIKNSIKSVISLA